MPRKPSDSPQIVYYVETGSEFTFRRQSHIADKLGNTHCLFAKIPSWFFNTKTKLFVDCVLIDYVIDDIITQSNKLRYMHVIVDDGKYFISQTRFASILNSGTLCVRKVKNSYRLKKDADTMPEESYAFHIGEHYFCVSLQNPESGCRIDILHYANFGANTLAELCELAGTQDDVRISEVSSLRTLRELCELKADMFIKLHRQYISICYQANRTKPRRSLSQTALSVYQSVCKHGDSASYDNEMITYWERQCVTQPLVRMFGSGTYGGPCYILDMAAMYPYICMTRRIPVTADEMLINPSDDDLAKMLRLYDFVAYCSVTDKTQTIPKIIGGKISWPIGRYNTVLPSPEFRRALAMRSINKVYVMLRMTDISYLGEFCKVMMNIRKKYEDENNKLGSVVTKMITNTIFGQLASRITVWRSVKLNYEPMPWHIWYERDLDKGVQRMLRTIGTECEEMAGKCERAGTQPAAFAFILSHARLLMNDIINIAGRHNTFLVNTDSIIVNEEGFRNLQNLIDCDGYNPGRLRIKEKGTKCVLFSQSQKSLLPPSEISEPEIVHYMTARQTFESIRGAIIASESNMLEKIMPAGAMQVYRHGKPIDENFSYQFRFYEPEEVSEPILENVSDIIG